MGNVFNKYASYYELLYKDKNYKEEVDYVTKLISDNIKCGDYILELGCGTGMHAELLLESGYRVHAIDLSESMVSQAIERSKKLEKGLREKAHFSVGDVRSYRTDERFDVVISLFHVLSYQNSNEDVKATLQTVKEHLKVGGIFIVDFWYGPAVLNYLPETRVKRLESDEISVIRLAEPVLHENENVVDVNYTVIIRDKSTKEVDELKEKHSMRYYFKPELIELLKQSGFELLKMEEWVTGAPPSKDTWGVNIVARKI